MAHEADHLFAGDQLDHRPQLVPLMVFAMAGSRVDELDAGWIDTMYAVLTVHSSTIESSPDDRAAKRMSMAAIVPPDPPGRWFQCQRRASITAPLSAAKMLA